MNFTSEIFLFYFLPLTLLVLYLLKNRSVTIALAWLSLASLTFYAWEMPHYVFLVLFSVTIDWFASNGMLKTERKDIRKGLLLLSIISNLGLLAYFKYSGFFAENVEGLGNALGIALMPHELVTFLKGVVLPAGISFYTFTALSYTVDIYYRKVHRARTFIEFLAYITMFPHLVAGPIVRYSDIEAQLKELRVRSLDIEEGLHFFIFGLAKKVLIADSFASLAELVFDTGSVTNGFVTLLGVIAYSLQLYFDFSGYSEMAVGLGLFLGVRFPQNFNSPYKASSIGDFWKRWHMTLSYWFRDYVYIPMGGSRCGPVRRTFNLIATMSICGFWHGAGWNFLLWGTGHGVALVLDKWWSKSNDMIAAWGRRAFCLVVVIALWIPFRAKTTDNMTRIFHNMGQSWTVDLVGAFKTLPKDALFAVLLIVPVTLLVFFGKNVFELDKRMSPLKSLALTALFIVSAYTLLARDYIPFLYFQF